MRRRGRTADHDRVAAGARERRRLVAAIVATTLAFAGALTAVALASVGLTVSSVANSTLNERVTVDARGRTLYALSPETARHLLCKSSLCLKIWPPLTVRSSRTKLTAGSGVHGHLALLRRSNGALQVTLGGRPLYRYSGDSGRDEANGEGVHTFGGVWHVVLPAPGAAPQPPATPKPPAQQPPYSY